MENDQTDAPSVPSFEKPVPLRQGQLAVDLSIGSCTLERAYLSMTTAGVWFAMTERISAHSAANPLKIYFDPARHRRGFNGSP